MSKPFDAKKKVAGPLYKKAPGRRTHLLFSFFLLVNFFVLVPPYGHHMG
jgi:hypothetical protein